MPVSKRYAAKIPICSIPAADSRKSGFNGVKAFWLVLSRLNSKHAVDFVDPSFAYDIDDVDIV